MTPEFLMFWANAASNIIIMLACAVGMAVVANAHALEGHPICAWSGRLVFLALACASASYLIHDVIGDGRTGTPSTVVRGLATAGAMTWIVALFHFRRL